MWYNGKNRKERGFFLMWNCGRCGMENGDTSAFCTGCGAQRPAPGVHPGAQPGYASYQPQQRQQVSPEDAGYNDRLSPAARALETWGKVIFILGIAVGALLFLGLTITSCSLQGSYSYYGGFSSYQVGTMIGGVIGALISGGLCVVGGLLLKAVLNGFAVIVEAQYRKLKPERK